MEEMSDSSGHTAGIWRSTVVLWKLAQLVLQLINCHFHTSQVVFSYYSEIAVVSSICNASTIKY